MPEVRFGSPSGPVHVEGPEPSLPTRALCGVRRQYRHRTTDRAATCPKCLRKSQEG